MNPFAERDQQNSCRKGVGKGQTGPFWFCASPLSFENCEESRFYLAVDRSGPLPGMLPGTMASDETLIPALVSATAQVARIIESALELLQEAQASVPAPSLEEVAEMRQGRRPLTREAFLLATLQRAMIDAENLASDLRGIDEGLRKVHEVRLTAPEFNALEEAVRPR